MCNQVRFCISMDSATRCLSGCQAVVATVTDTVTKLNCSLLHALLSLFLYRNTVMNLFFFIMSLLPLKKKHSFYNRKWLILSTLAAVLFPSVQWCYCNVLQCPSLALIAKLKFCQFICPSLSRMQCTGFASNSDFKSEKVWSSNKRWVESGLRRVQFLFIVWTLSNEQQLKSAVLSRS